MRGAQHASVSRLGNFTVVCAPNALDRNRLGVTATRKTGDAVTRNRFKREAREFFRLRSPGWPQGLDLLFIARVPPWGDPPLHALMGGDGERRLVKALRRSLELASKGGPYGRQASSGRKGSSGRGQTFRGSGNGQGKALRDRSGKASGNASGRGSGNASGKASGKTSRNASPPPNNRSGRPSGPERSRPPVTGTAPGRTPGPGHPGSGPEDNP
jgi:RNase P protein component